MEAAPAANSVFTLPRAIACGNYAPAVMWLLGPGSSLAGARSSGTRHSRVPGECSERFARAERDPGPGAQPHSGSHAIALPLWGRVASEASGVGSCGNVRVLPHNNDPHPQPLPSRSRVYPILASPRVPELGQARVRVGRGADRVRGAVVCQDEWNTLLTRCSPPGGASSRAIIHAG